MSLSLRGMVVSRIGAFRMGWTAQIALKGFRKIMRSDSRARSVLF